MWDADFPANAGKKSYIPSFTLASLAYLIPRSQALIFTSWTFFGTFDFIEIPISKNDKYYQLKAGQEGRWDLLSFNEYQTIEYWWFICLANNIYNPMESPPAGTLLRIPDINTLSVLDNT